MNDHRRGLVRELDQEERHLRRRLALRLALYGVLVLAVVVLRAVLAQ